jgi:hypothetical protein
MLVGSNKISPTFLVRLDCYYNAACHLYVLSSDDDVFLAVSGDSPKHSIPSQKPRLGNNTVR